MASLYIKDSATAALATEVAGRLGTTKTEAVSRGLRCLDAARDARPMVPQGRTVDWLRRYRAEFPLPKKDALKIDKAFYDSLSDEEDTVDPWTE